KKQREKDKKKVKKNTKALIRPAFANLPQEVLLDILSFLPLHDLKSLSMTSKWLYPLTEDDLLWHPTFLRLFHSEPTVTFPKLYPLILKHDEKKPANSHLLASDSSLVTWKQKYKYMISHLYLLFNTNPILCIDSL